MSSPDPAPDGTPKIERLIALEEGFYVPGSLPNRNHNPGDLRHSPHSFHTAAAPNAIGVIDDDTDGWLDLSGQLKDYIRDYPGITVEEAIHKYAPPSENNTDQYIDFVLNGAPHEGVSGLGCAPDTLLWQAIQILGDPHA